MTPSEFKRIARLLKSAYAQLEEEALAEGIDPFSDEYYALQKRARELVLQRMGYTLEQYRAAKEKVAPKQAAKDLLEEIKHRDETTKEELMDIAEEAVRKNTVPAQHTTTIVNKIVKEKVVEKPVIVKETVFEEYDDNEIKKGLEEVKKSVEASLEETDRRVDEKLSSLPTTKENIGVLQMPDFRKLAMGLQTQIDDVRSNANSSWGHITGTLSDQTDLQSALDAKLQSGDNISELVNDAGYLTGVTVDAPLSGAGTSASHLTVDLSSKQDAATNLTSLSGLSYVSTSFVKMTGAGTFALDTNTYLTSVTAHNLLSTTHGDTTAGSVARGDLITGQGVTPSWTKLAIGTAGKVLQSDGTDVAWSTNALTIGASASVAGSNTGDVTLTGTPDYITISGQTITRGLIDLTTDVTGDLPFANIAQISTSRILGRTTASTGDIEQLTVSSPLSLSGGALGVTQSAIDHGSIGGLTDDDHTQYALLAGRSGGQTLIGGTGAGDDIFVQSTSDPTKGKIIFGTSAYDEVNNRLGIGTTTPDLDGLVVYGSGVKYLKVQSTNNAVQWRMQTDTNNRRFLALDAAGNQLGQILFNNTSIEFWGASTSYKALFLDVVNLNLGLGVQSFGTSASKVLAIGNGVKPTSSPADMVQLYSTDLSAGNATLGIRTETAVVSSAAGASDAYLNIDVNGTTYKLLLHT